MTADTTTARSATKQPAEVDVARAQLAGFLVTPVIQPQERAWHPAHLTEQQQRDRAAFEQAMRADKLRALPSVFGDLG